MSNLDDKMLKFHYNKFDQLCQRAEQVNCLSQLLTINDQKFRRESVEIAKRITVADLKALKEGKYFDEPLFMATLRLYLGMNQVARECERVMSDRESMPKWTHKYTGVKPFHLMESLVWNGEQLKFPTQTTDLKQIRGNILLPVVLPAERQAFLVHFNTETLQATMYVP